MGNIVGTWSAVALLVVSLLISGCSKGKEPVKETTTDQAQADPQKAAATPAPVVDEELPPILRTPWQGDLEGMVKRRIVRVLLPFRRPEFFYVEGRPVGILQEAFQELERVLNEKYKTRADNRIVVALLPTPLDKLQERMMSGHGDIAAYGISITERNRALVDFTIPTMTGLKIVVVTGPGAPVLNSLDDLSGKDVWIHPGSRLRGDLETLNAKLKAKGKAPARMREVDPLLQPGDVAEMVNTGLYPIALMQSMQAEFWSKVFDQMKARPDLALAEDVELGWAINKGTPHLKALLDDFIKTHGANTGFGGTLVRRYMKDVKYVRNATEVSELKKFQTTAPIFRKYSEQYDFDHLMMVAQGYQESQLDQGAKSRVGAVGIMQVMPSTAAGHPVKISNIDAVDNNIHAGIRLMSYLVKDHYNEPGLDPFNRTLFAIAAYNAGPGRINTCRQKAKAMGYDPNKWFGNVEVAVAKVVGRETTQYVANIYKYYIAYKMAREMQMDRNNALERVKAGAAKPK